MQRSTLSQHSLRDARNTRVVELVFRIPVSHSKFTAVGRADMMEQCDGSVHCSRELHRSGHSQC
jgi:hypothetical protein